MIIIRLMFWGQRGETDKVGVLWPDAIRKNELLYVDVHESGILEPFLELWAGTDLVAGLFEGARDFIIVALEISTVEATIFRHGVAIPVLEFNPTPRLN